MKMEKCVYMYTTYKPKHPSISQNKNFSLKLKVCKNVATMEYNEMDYFHLKV